MHQRSVYAVIVLVALLTSAAGNLITAAFCPNAGRTHTVCGQTVPQADVSHSGMTHDMHGMEMGEMPISIDRSDTAGLQSDDLFEAHDALSSWIEKAFGRCIHCVSHSKVPTNALTLRQSNTPTSSHVDEPAVVVNISSLLLLPRAINARGHAPPAQSSPLHIRLNVFRI